MTDFYMLLVVLNFVLFKLIHKRNIAIVMDFSEYYFVIYFLNIFCCQNLEVQNVAKEDLYDKIIFIPL